MLELPASPKPQLRFETRAVEPKSTSPHYRPIAAINGAIVDDCELTPLALSVTVNE